MVRQGQCSGMATAAEIAARLLSQGSGVQGVAAFASGGADRARNGGVPLDTEKGESCTSELLRFAAAIERPKGRRGAVIVFDLWRTPGMDCGGSAANGSTTSFTGRDDRPPSCGAVRGVTGDTLLLLVRQFGKSCSDTVASEVAFWEAAAVLPVCVFALHTCDAAAAAAAVCRAAGARRQDCTKCCSCRNARALRLSTRMVCNITAVRGRTADP
jgi:hypothetical protein